MAVVSEPLEYVHLLLSVPHHDHGALMLQLLKSEFRSDEVVCHLPLHQVATLLDLRRGSVVAVYGLLAVCLATSAERVVSGVDDLPNLPHPRK